MRGLRVPLVSTASLSTGWLTRVRALHLQLRLEHGAPVGAQESRQVGVHGASLGPSAGCAAEEA